LNCVQVFFLVEAVDANSASVNHLPEDTTNRPLRTSVNVISIIITSSTYRHIYHWANPLHLTAKKSRIWPKMKLREVATHFLR